MPTQQAIGGYARLSYRAGTQPVAYAPGQSVEEVISIAEAGKPTIHDIAALAGVSASTVSRAMNGKAGVGAEVRARIERIIAEQGFRANLSARKLSTGRSWTLGVVFPLHASEVVMHPVYPALLGALGDAAEVAGYDIMLLTVAAPEHADRLLDRVRDRRLDGVVLPAAGARDPLLRQLTKLGVPIVLIGHRSRSPDVAWVDCTHDLAARDLTRMMLAAGRRRLLLVNGPKRVSACRLRSAGFWTAVKEAGDAVESAEEVEAEFEAETGRARAYEALSGPDRPTAVLCGADVIASGCLEAARSLGLDVPGDVAVSGFDDRTLATHTTPTLTTVRMPLRETGEEAARLLFALIDGKEQRRRHVILPTTVVLRDSTPPAQGGDPLEPPM
jgi:LacI family transcriptional regulator